MKDSYLIAVGCGCLVVGLPILVIGVVVYVGGLSGGQFPLALCCTELGTDPLEGSATHCSTYKSSAACSGFPMAPDAALAAANTTSWSLGPDVIRSDASYKLIVDVPRGCDLEGTLTVTAPGGRVVTSASINVAPSLLDRQHVCDIMSEGSASSDHDGDDRQEGYPPFVRTEVLASFKLEGDEAVTDEAHAVITSSSQITDTTGVLAATATGGATYSPRFEVDSNGMSTKSVLGLVLLIVGAIIAFPPCCVIVTCVASHA